MERIKSQIIGLVKNGTFGIGEFLGLENGSIDGTGAHLMSEVVYFTLKYREGKIPKEQSIFVKVQLTDVHRARDLSTGLQFNNEIAIYSEIFPELGAGDIGMVPKMLHGHSSNGLKIEQDILILEDLRTYGYRVIDDIFLDKVHTVQAMRKLGEFHGLSYRMKRTAPKRFGELHKLLQPRNFNLPKGFFEGSLYRGFQPIIDNPIVRAAYDKLDGITVKQIGKPLNSPEEPFAVIIHGDFNKNNIMYQYNKEKLANVKVVDFGNSFYSDPSIDIAFFLYLNTSDELRRAHWDEFLQAYWQGVSAVVNPGFSYEEFLVNFAKKAIWGYISCCFVLPILMFPGLQKLKNTETSFKEKWKFGMTAGGDAATDAVSSIVRHLLDRGYLEAFADHVRLPNSPLYSAQ